MREDDLTMVQKNPITHPLLATTIKVHLHHVSYVRTDDNIAVLFIAETTRKRKLIKGRKFCQSKPGIPIQVDPRLTGIPKRVVEDTTIPLSAEEKFVAQIARLLLDGWYSDSNSKEEYVECDRVG